MAITQRFATENHVATELNNITLDKTLSIEDVPADAKAVGDALDKLEEQIPETWELLTDITLEEEVNTIDNTYFTVPQKKVLFVLDTLAAETATNYMPVTIFTADVNYAKNIKFYPKAMPFTSAARSVYECEVLGSGKALISWGSNTSVPGMTNGRVYRLSDGQMDTGKMIIEPIDAYNNVINDEITGFTILTYSTFAAGTRLRVWGVAK